MTVRHPIHLSSRAKAREAAAEDPGSLAWDVARQYPTAPKRPRLSPRAGGARFGRGCKGMGVGQCQ